MKGRPVVADSKGFGESDRLPPSVAGLPDGLRPMTAVASGAQVTEIKPQIRTPLDRNFMVGMEVSLTTRECLAQFFQHMLRARKPQSNLAEQPDELRLPPAIYAAPAVAFEAADTQPAVVHIVAALGATSASLIDCPHRLRRVLRAPRRLRHERGAAWMGTGVEDGGRHYGCVSCALRLTNLGVNRGNTVNSGNGINKVITVVMCAVVNRCPLPSLSVYGVYKRENKRKQRFRP